MRRSDTEYRMLLQTSKEEWGGNLATILSAIDFKNVSFHESVQKRYWFTQRAAALVDDDERDEQTHE